MKVRLRQTVRSREAGVLDEARERVPLYAKLMWIIPWRITDSLRTEAGRIEADKQPSKQMLYQVTLSLARPRAVEREPSHGRDAKRKPRPVMATALRPDGRSHKPREAWFRLS
jgi:hypothetical protein